MLHINKKKKKVYQKYSDSQLAADALKYNTITEWRNASRSMFEISRRRDLIRKITLHMTPLKKLNGYWTKDKIKEIASKFNSMQEWRKKDSTSYWAAKNFKLLNEKEITGHLVRKTSRKHSKEYIFEEAKKFKSIKEWSERSLKSYQAAVYLGVTKEASKHMEPLGNTFKRCIYLIKVPSQNLAYIGLTGNFKKRIDEHLLSNRFKKIIELYGRDSLDIQKLTNYLDVKSAIDYEVKLIKEMKSIGYKVLNKNSGGAIGGSNTKWTEDKIIENFKQYKNYKEWRVNSRSAYEASIKINLHKKIKFLK